MLLRLLRWVVRMYQEGLNPPEENTPEQVLQSPYATEPIQINLDKGKKISMDSRDITVVVGELNSLLGDAERIQELASEKADALTEIKDQLEEANTTLGEAVSALEGLEEIVETVENLLNDADNEGIN